MRLRPFQTRFMRRALAPGIDTAALSLPRGNGKSWLGAQTLTNCLTPGDPLHVAGAEFLLCAASLEQARLTFQFCRADLEPTGEYRFLDSVTRIGITHKATNTRLRVMSSKAKSAFGIVGCPLLVADEPGCWETTNGTLMFDAIQTAQGKPGSAMRAVYIGTLAPSSGGWWHDLIGGGSHGSTYVQALTGNVKRWDLWGEIRRCNPLTSISPEFRAKLLDERDKARRDSRLKARFLSYRLNVPTGEHSEALRPHLAAIARGLTSHGESVFEITVERGRLGLLPCKISNVYGHAEPSTWRYALTRGGPSEDQMIARDGAAVLHFRSHVDPNQPHRGRPPLSASSSTARVLAEIEAQLSKESRLLPTRVITGGSVGEQARDIEESLRRGGVVTLLQAQATAMQTDPSGIRAGAIKNETTAAVVKLHEDLTRVVCSVLGVPSDLILAGSEAGSRESFRRFAASTISPLLSIVRTEWEAKVGALEYDLSALRASDQTAISRALGSRATAFQKLITGGVPLGRALEIAGLDG